MSVIDKLRVTQALQWPKYSDYIRCTVQSSSFIASSNFFLTLLKVKVLDRQAFRIALLTLFRAWKCQRIREREQLAGGMLCGKQGPSKQGSDRVFLEGGEIAAAIKGEPKLAAIGGDWGVKEGGRALLLEGDWNWARMGSKMQRGGGGRLRSLSIAFIR